MGHKLSACTLLALAVAFSASFAGAAPVGDLAEFGVGLNAGSVPFRIVSGADGNLWFSDQGPTKALGRITTSGVITEPVTLPAGSVPRQVRVGADGNVWFTDTNPAAPLIGRINADGSVTTFPLPAGSNPNAFAVGDDDALWITDRGASPAIRRLTTDGQLATFRVGLNPGATPNGIAPGPDGALWFTDQGVTKAIGRIALDGTITERSAGLNAGSNPAAISPAADGNMYFTDQGTTKAIGKIALPAGTITETSLASNSNPQEITPGADGHLWFTDRGATKQLGDLAPDGTITLHPQGVPPTSSPGGVRTGPDGNLWFVDNGAPQAIARYGVGAPAASVTPPMVEGGGGVGNAQTCASGVWSNWAGAQPSFTRFGFDGFRWLRDGTPLYGQTTATYTPTVADLGHALSCSQTGTYLLFPVTVTASSASVLVRDVTAPMLTLPASTTVDATSPQGAGVTFTALAADDVDPSVTAVCSPPSGTTFPIGTTTVQCSATDAAGNTSAGWFVIVVNGARAQLAELAAAVVGVGPGRSLAATVAVAQLFLGRGATQLTCLMLGVLKLEIRAQTGRTIPAKQALELGADTNRIRAVLDC